MIGPRATLLVEAAVLLAGGVYFLRRFSRAGICVELAGGGGRVCAGDVPVEPDSWNPVRALEELWRSLPTGNGPLGGGITWGSQGSKPPEWWGEPDR